MADAVAGADGSLLARLALARRRRTRNSALEAASLGLAAAAAGAAALLVTLGPRGEAGAVELAACALLSGVPMAATWWVERAKATDLDLARRIDARLGAEGALAAAYEAGAQLEGGAVARALERRVQAFLDRAALRRALPGPGWIWLAPPALALALLALALESPELRSLGGVVGQPAGPAGDASGAVARARAALARAQATGAGAADAAERLEELGLAARDLEGQAAQGRPSGDGGAATASLLRELARERARLAREAGPAGVGGAGDTPPAPGAGAVSGGAGAEAAGSLLTGEARDRTMVRSNPSTTAADGSRTAPTEPATGSGAEAGTLAGRWWNERQDPVVQGWRKALAARAGGH